MKGLFLALLGLVIGAGFLVSAAFSDQVTPYTNYYGFGAVNESGSNSPAPTSGENMGEDMVGPQSGVTLEQQNGSYGSIPSLSSNSTEDSMGRSTGEPYFPGVNSRCIGVSGGVAC
jgi:hypothetical protein